jgi:hypothetical protein
MAGAAVTLDMALWGPRYRREEVCDRQFYLTLLIDMWSELSVDLALLMCGMVKFDDEPSYCIDHVEMPYWRDVPIMVTDSSIPTGFTTGHDKHPVYTSHTYAGISWQGNTYTTIVAYPDGNATITRCHIYELAPTDNPPPDGCAQYECSIGTIYTWTTNNALFVEVKQNECYHIASHCRQLVLAQDDLHAIYFNRDCCVKIDGIHANISPMSDGAWRILKDFFRGSCAPPHPLAETNVCSFLPSFFPRRAKRGAMRKKLFEFIYAMTTLYVLSCRHACWYVGTTSSLKSALACHFTGKGSGWTRLHKPILLFESRETTGPADEYETTSSFMRTYGIDKVRCESVMPTGTINVIKKMINKDGPKCFICNRFGHLAKNCPEWGSP